jgi:glycosyltransferase involved in cell wall biosynthesis
MNKINVLFVVPTLRRAGAECQVVSIANHLSNSRFNKYLFYYAPGNDLLEDIDLTQVTVFEKARRGKLDVNVGRRIAQIIDEFEIDIVHCTLLNALVFGCMGTYFSKRNPRVIGVIHTTKNANLKLDIVDWLVHRSLLKQCDRVWFVSTNQAEVWVRKMPFIMGKQETIHNGVDTSFFDPAAFKAEGSRLRSELGISPGDKVVCSVAAFRPEKLHQVLIDAIHNIDIDRTTVWLLLAGVGPTESKIRNKVKSMGLESRVKFLGSLADVRPLLAASDCKVLASEAETFSMAMLEAMSMKVPVITTLVGGASEAIENEVTGLLVQPNNAGELALKIEMILLDDQRRLEMGERARETIVSRFSILSMLANTEQALLDVARNV